MSRHRHLTRPNAASSALGQEPLRWSSHVSRLSRRPDDRRSIDEAIGADLADIVRRHDYARHATPVVYMDCADSRAGWVECRWLAHDPEEQVALFARVRWLLCMNERWVVYLGWWWSEGQTAAALEAWHACVASLRVES